MLTLDEIIKATSGKLICGNRLNISIKGVSTDSRSIKPGELFIALKGEKFDGHQYVSDVIQKGAHVLVVSKKVKVPADILLIQVKDTAKALGQIAGFYRRKFDIPIIAITGSAGKTTTKEMVAHVLSTQYKVLKNIKTENNHIGVPQTLLKLDQTCEIAILECGTNQPGDIQWLAKILNPTVVIFTNIGDSHLEKLKNRKGVFKEKFNLVKFMALNGLIIFNRDDAFLSEIDSMKISQKKITYSIKKKSQYQAKRVSLNKNGQISFAVNDHEFILNAWAEHNIYNALPAIVCAGLFNIKKSNLQNSLKTFVNCSGRQEIKKFNGLTVIDDTYNANPISFRSAVDALSIMKVRGKKILICSDMLELGKESKKLHAELGAYIGESRIDKILSYGPYAQWISQSAKKKRKNIEAWHYDSQINLEKDMKKFCHERDAVLVKGSRGMHMEKIVEALKQTFSR